VEWAAIDAAVLTYWTPALLAGIALNPQVMAAINLS